MKYMLDTNICIYLMNKGVNRKALSKKLSSLRPGDIAISSITYAELCYGVEKSQYQKKNHAALDKFIMQLDVLEFDEAAACHYGIIRAQLESKGMPIGSLDFMIASHARAAGLVLVTNNTAEFERVSALTVENWV